MNAAVSLRLSELDVRVLRATDSRYERTPEEGGELAGGVSGAEGALRGVLFRGGRGGSGEGCRCRRGELHGPYTYLAVYADGRSRTIYVPAAAQAVAEAHVELTRHNEAVLAEISQINL